MGQAGSACSGGLAIYLYQWSSILSLLLLGWVFAPIYLQGLLVTVPQYFENRFGSTARWLLAFITLLSYVVTKISASIYAGALLLKVMVGWEMWVSVPVILILTGAYTIGGGLRAVIYTDMIQMLIFCVGGCIGGFVAFDRIGGLSGLRDTLEEANLTHLGHFYHPIDDIEYPITGMIIGTSITNIFYWCMVRR